MKTSYDCIVIGVGGMGSAVVSHLAAKGVDVLGIEQFDVPHTQGSSHGYTRIVRLAYFEHPSYVPLLRRAYELWEQLEEERDERLLYRTGSITAGVGDGAMFRNARNSCNAHDIAHDCLTAAELRDRYPGYEVPSDYRAVYQADGGFVSPERAIVAQVERAFDEGGTIHARERVRDWSATTQGVVVETDRRQYTADKLVVTAGAWSSKLLQIVEGRAQPERQVLGWFQPPNPEAFAPERFPVFTLDVDEGEFYGFPIFGVPGFKIGRHHHRHQETDPDEMNREPTREDERLLRRFVEKYFPSAAGPTMRLETCLYTNSPDEQFIIDTHPDHSNVVLAAGFSGHGFKFSTVVGEILADLAIDGDTDHEIELFRLDRF